MELLILKAIAFLRPIFFIELHGTNIFELAAVGSFLILSFAFLYNTALRQTVRITSTDFLIFAFTIWCLTAFVVYIDTANVREVAKLIIPVLTYIITKNVVKDEQGYTEMVFVMIVGFAVPVAWSAVAMLSGDPQALAVINYWSQEPRYQGIYVNPHTMGHNMGFVLLLMMVYLILRGPLRKWLIVFFVSLSFLALYGLYMSAVRTAILGIIVFAGIYVFYTNRKLFFTGAIVVAILGIVAFPLLAPRFFHDLQKVQKGEWEASEFASGRPKIWANNLAVYSKLSIDRKLAGVGIGNKGGLTSGKEVIDSHNDYLDLLMQVGLIGLLLYLAIHVVVLVKIIRLSENERYIFLALFWAITIMNFVSNSYITRFGLAQMYWMIIAYVEIANKNRKYYVKKTEDI